MGEKKQLLTHWLHSHSLKLTQTPRGGQLACKLCLGSISTKTPQKLYVCQSEGCRFYLHPYCSTLPQQLDHFFHPHTLHFHIHNPLEFQCNACASFGKGLFYECRDCNFIMHPKCAYPPPSVRGNQILHHSHHHPLHPTRIEEHFWCDICWTNPSRDPAVWGCQQCNPLKPTPNEKDLRCRTCERHSSSAPAAWGCLQCNFKAHDYCLEKFPRQVQPPGVADDDLAAPFYPTRKSYHCFRCHVNAGCRLGFRSSDWSTISGHFMRVTDEPDLCFRCAIIYELLPRDDPFPIFLEHFLHPSHQLQLQFRPFSTCNACNQKHHDFAYHCYDCNFFVHLGCHQAPTIEDSDQILRFCHSHPLKLNARDRSWSKGLVLCHICEERCSDTFYSCSQCDFNIHEFCLDILPHETRDHLLNALLILLPLPSFKCETCNRSFFSTLAFFWIGRWTWFCVKCILWPGGRFKSIHHEHPLTNGRRDEAEKIPCFMCGAHCSGWTYDCKDCSISIHKSCAELPRRIEMRSAPGHPKHPLTLSEKPPAAQNCGLCLKSFSQNSSAYARGYWCKACKIHLDCFCVVRQPSLQYQGGNHLHLLTIVENMSAAANCGVCNRSCKGFTTLRCVKCKLILHLFCGPLPTTIKHPCHVHPLTIQEYYVEDNESDEFACHVCEEHRDPRLRVYRCSEDCLMICDVECVISEVLPFLRGERGDVELRTPYPQVASKVIIKKSVYGELRLTQVDRDAEEIPEKKDPFSIPESIKKKELSVKTNYAFSWNEFSRFVEQFQAPSNSKLVNDFWQKHNESATAGEYELPVTLGPIYEEFFGKHGIVIGNDDGKLGFKKRQRLVLILCCVLHEMKMTKVTDATQEKILEWLGWIRYVEKEGGFDLGFLVDSFRQQWKAHFLIESKQIVDERSMDLRRGIEQESKAIAELEAQLEAKREVLRGLKLEEKAHEAYWVAGARGLKKVYKDALEIKWRSCYESAIRNAPTTSSSSI